MEIKTKFEMGQRVWCVSTRGVMKPILCSLCNDTKRVMISGKEYICPACANGSQKYSTRHLIIASGYIGKIAVEVYGTKAYVPVHHRGILEEKYMITDTGIGSGNVWDVKQLFTSKEGAQEFCDTKNKELEDAGY